MRKWTMPSSNWHLTFDKHRIFNLWLMMNSDCVWRSAHKHLIFPEEGICFVRTKIFLARILERRFSYRISEDRVHALVGRHKLYNTMRRLKIATWCRTDLTFWIIELTARYDKNNSTLDSNLLWLTGDFFDVTFTREYI